jgi:protocatechuate 3,4-dioxygenase beta subunit
LLIATVAAVAAMIVAYRSTQGAGAQANSLSTGSSREAASDGSTATLDGANAELRPAEEIREAVPSAQPSISEASGGAPNSESALLLVHVVDSQGHEPVRGVLVSGRKKGDGRDSVIWSVPDPKSKGNFRNPPMTDENGRVELDVASGFDLFLILHGQNSECEEKIVTVPSLRPGERRELRAELDCGNELRVFGSVVDVSGSKPIGGALVRACLASVNGGSDRHSWELKRTTTDASGGFEVRIRSKVHPFVRIEAGGFGAAILRRLDGHDSPERAVIVELAKSATLEAAVRDANGSPIQHVMIHLSAEGYELPPDAGSWDDVDVPAERWQGATSSDGTCTIEGLSPGVGIAIELTQDGRLLRRETDPLELEPGQVLHREWVLGGGATLNGLVLDQDSRPVPQLEIWLTKWEPEGGHSYEGYQKDRVSDHALSDADGRFQLKDVAPGTWWLGPAPHDRDWEVDASGTARMTDPPADAIAPIGSPVEVNSVASQDVTLRVHRGLFIRGRVLDPDGKPASDAGVDATASSNGLGPHCECGADGTFAIGPVGPGKYTLIADAIERFANSDPVEAEAGASDVVLRLKAGGGLRGRVVDTRTGKPCAAEMILTPRVPGKGLFGTGEGFGVDDNGMVDRQGLPPGDYDLAARTEDGCFGILPGLTVVAGEKGKEFVLPVSPGGTLNIRYAGEHPSALVSLRQQGVLLLFPMGVNAGKVREMHAPAGTFDLEARLEPDSAPKSRTVHLDPGEVKEIALTDSD